MEHELSVTIKYGKGYDESWAVFKGAPEAIRDDIITYFGLTVDPGMTLHEVVLMGTAAAHGAAELGRQLGAVPISQEKPQGTPAGASAFDQLDGEAGGEQKVSEGTEHQWLIDQLNAASTVDELKALWAGNKSAFADPNVKAAYSARGKALKAAS